ncbi:hypothetical protein OG458_42200 (plasmid) [Streptomyces sp. NBC_01281]|uniref:hypothetical protein n=1 Tax=Streptomyces sp. NBC_01281 TaxID=2903811 RepID=UPI002E10F8CA|nr:hypothetical protein OG458_42200 [Streptomyces sp. NBC_01281]
MSSRHISERREDRSFTPTNRTTSPPLTLSWTGLVTAPGAHSDITVVGLVDEQGGTHHLELDDDRREALGMVLIDPSDPDEVAAENDDTTPADEPALEDETAYGLFHHLLTEAEQRQPTFAHQVRDLSEPDCLDYLLTHGPLDPQTNKVLITAIRLLDPERFGAIS